MANYDNNLKLVIAGDGEERNDLQKIIDKLKLKKKIKLIGNKKNLTKLFLEAKAFVLSSLWEDPGFVLIEAMSYGTFVISSNVKNINSDVIKNGYNGFLYDLNKNDDLLKVYLKFSKLNMQKKNIVIKNAANHALKFSVMGHGIRLTQLLNKI